MVQVLSYRSYGVLCLINKKKKKNNEKPKNISKRIIASLKKEAVDLTIRYFK